MGFFKPVQNTNKRILLDLIRDSHIVQDISEWPQAQTPSPSDEISGVLYQCFVFPLQYFSMCYLLAMFR